MRESAKLDRTKVSVAKEAAFLWPNWVRARVDSRNNLSCIECESDAFADVCTWLFFERLFSFASLIVDENLKEWHLRYIFYKDLEDGLVEVRFNCLKTKASVPSIGKDVYAARWHEKEAEKQFSLIFEGCPQLNPDLCKGLKNNVQPKIREGIYVIHPLYSKHRGVEKLAEGKEVLDVLLLSERFSGTASFAHSLAFCQAIETISDVDVPRRAKALRILFAELERLRHHVSVIRSICASTAMVEAMHQASVIEETLLRLCCTLTGHRYLFGLNVPGVSRWILTPNLLLKGFVVLLMMWARI